MKNNSFDVLAVGELNADLIFTGLESAPVLNREILADGYRMTLGSSTAICAANLAKLGLRVAFCGKVGDDDHGRFVLEELNRRGVDTSFCVTDPQVTTGVTLALNWLHDRALVTVPGAMACFSLADFDTSILQIARHVHVGAFFLQTALQKDLPRFFGEARQLGVTTSLDAGWDPTENWDYGIRDTLAHTDIFFPNETEAAHITGESDSETAARILAQYGGMAVVKRGGDGSVCVTDGRTYAKPSVKNVKVVDTTGAGDSFNAGFIYAYLNRLPIDACLAYGNVCGALSVASAGGANADLDAEKVRVSAAAL